MAEPTYYPMTTYTEKPEGEYAAGPDLDVCQGCGSVVGDQARHNEWHASLVDLLLRMVERS